MDPISTTAEQINYGVEDNIPEEDIEQSRYKLIILDEKVPADELEVSFEEEPDGQDREGFILPEDVKIGDEIEVYKNGIRRKVKVTEAMKSRDFVVVDFSDIREVNFAEASDSSFKIILPDDVEAGEEVEVNNGKGKTKIIQVQQDMKAGDIIHVNFSDDAEVAAVTEEVVATEDVVAQDASGPETKESIPAVDEPIITRPVHVMATIPAVDEPIITRPVHVMDVPSTSEQVSKDSSPDDLQLESTTVVTNKSSEDLSPVLHRSPRPPKHNACCIIL